MKQFKGYHEIFTDEFGKYKMIHFDITCSDYAQMTETDIKWAERAGHVTVSDVVFRGKKYGPKPNTTVSKKLY